MRKTFLSYLMVIMITFVVGVSMVEAEDYNFSVKLYKLDDPSTFWENYQSGLLEEVPANGVVDAGQKIAVGVYVETKNATASAFDLRLNWDDSILDPIKNEYGGNEFIENLKPISAGGIYPNYDGIDNINITGWKYADYGDYYLDNTSRTLVIIRDYRNNTLFNGNGIMYWLVFKVKQNVTSGSYFTFGFNRAEAFANLGRNEVDVVTTPVTFKVSNPIERYSVGDINGNGKIDYGDYLLIISYVGKLTMLTGEEIVAADINGDGKVNVLDQTAMNKLYYRIE